MIQPLTLGQIGDFIQTCLYAFDDYLFFGFVAMMAFCIAMGVRALLIWGS